MGVPTRYATFERCFIAGGMKVDASLPSGAGWAWSSIVMVGRRKYERQSSEFQ